MPLYDTRAAYRGASVARYASYDIDCFIKMPLLRYGRYMQDAAIRVMSCYTLWRALARVMR